MERFNSFSSDQIILTKRQASMIMASMLLFCLFVFIVGFFLGKRVIIDDLSSQTTQKTLHDQIDYLLTTQSLTSSQDDYQESLEVKSSNDDLLSLLKEEETSPDQIGIEEVSQIPAILVDNNVKKSEKHSENKKQYAQLIGFGTKKAAQSFVDRLKKHDITVIIKTIVSKTASGKQKIWYQAITQTYESSEKLKDQVDKIKRLEHIRDKDIKIDYVK